MEDVCAWLTVPRHPSPVKHMKTRKSETVKAVAVVGAGWAGCAAAVELTLRGHRVTLLEAARIPGGRARGLRQTAGTAPVVSDDWTDRLDNGQHILLGAYTETLRMMRAVGVDIEASLLRLPLQMRYPPGTGGMDFVAPRLPAPFHLLVALLRTRGLARADKLALARFSSLARWIGWRLNQDCTVVQLLERFNQTERVTLLLWRPLCLAALNTPPERASAQVFLNVLRDSLGARRSASDMLLPRTDLSQLFPQPAARLVERHGGQVHYGVRVQAVVQAIGRRRLDTGTAALQQSEGGFDAVVLATPAAETLRILTPLSVDTAAMASACEPITTCYLQYAPTLSLPLPFYALQDVPALAHWGQFVFDRGQLDTAQAGLLAVVISASVQAVALDHPALGAAIALQLATVFGEPMLAAPARIKIISEKRATFSCTPGLARAPCASGIDGLLLAGDHVASDYPATIEAAVRSGIDAARAIG
ncbi:MAG: FAD-dependent oxidoreductase [Herminiimonas sp.]|nr:FAD-dependent oxidoreductase [Herminiimonas sp.]